jgi:hypothetical protein
MRNYYYPSNEKATVCHNSTCVTVFGDTAKLINGIAIAIAVITAISLISKALK